MSRPQHVYVTYIAAAPEQVWQALTSAEFTRQYFHRTSVESDFRKGSPVVFRNPDGSVAIEGEVLTADEPHCLAFTWQVRYDPELESEHPSRVCFEIDHAEGVTRLTVIHDEFEEGSKVYERIREGWAPILCSLKSLLETGHPLPTAGNQAG